MADKVAWGVLSTARIGRLQVIPAMQAADVFTRLSVGDGLVSQIPALIVSLAAGLLVSKGGTRGPADYPCDVDVRKGEELGWFEHGSTIILLAPAHFEFADNVREGGRIRAGQPLLRNV